MFYVTRQKNSYLNMKITITTFSDKERDKTKVTMKAHGWKIVMLGE